MPMLRSLRGLPARGDVWGGLAAMLVASPAAIAFGVSVYAAIGPAYAGHGAIAGLVGAVVIGMVAAVFGGTDRLVSAPCAPAAALLAAHALAMTDGGVAPGAVVVQLLAIGLLGGLLQVVLGLLGAGRLIRYIPSPVVSGYLTGLGLIILGGQISKVLGTTGDTGALAALLTPSLWDWRALLIAAVTIVTMVIAPQRTVPGTILGILAGLAAYLVLAAGDPQLRTFAGNPLIVGPLAPPGDDLFASTFGLWRDVGLLESGMLAHLLGSAAILAALLSIDTLKTCVVLDRLTRTRHRSDRELVAQGAANVAAAACGGVAGAGTLGATLVAFNSGAVTRAAGFLTGAFTLGAAVLAGRFLGWLPVPALAGILVVIGVRMIDRDALSFVRSRATILDFCVVVTVVAVALGAGLLTASAVGVGLAMILFVREQAGSSAVRHKLELGETSSTWHRPEREVALLAGRSADAVIFELQGPLFFGNTYRLYGDLEQEIGSRRFVIIDLRRVHSIDVTAAQLFEQVHDAIRERGARLLLCGLRPGSRRGRNLARLLRTDPADDAGEPTVIVLPSLDAAIAWVENRLVAEGRVVPEPETPIALQEMDQFQGYRDDTLADLEAHIVVRSYAAGDVIYASGSPGDELYWVRRGRVSLLADTAGGEPRQVAGFGRGDVFGGLSFLDGQPRPSSAVAANDAELYVLTRAAFDDIRRVHTKLAFNLAAAMARTLAMRLRRTERSLAALKH